MQLYTIGKTRYAGDLTGNGAKLNGGRWNHEGVPCIYLAQSRALSLLEYAAHAPLDVLPGALSFTTIEVPDQPMQQLTPDQLPGNWFCWPHSKESRDLGTILLTQKEYLLLKIPSAIITQEYNFILNPLHPLSNKVRIVAINDYAYDLPTK